MSEYERTCEAVVDAARELVDALDRMYGNLYLSVNVSSARDSLRVLVGSAVQRDPDDLAQVP